MTQDELSKLPSNITPPKDKVNKDGLPNLPTFTLLTPFILKDGDQVSMTKQHIGPGIEVTDNGKYTGRVLEPRYIGGVRYIVANKGTEIIPGIVDSEIASMEVFKNKPFITDKEYFGGVTVKVTRRDGTQYSVGYMSPDDVRSLVPLPILDNAPTYEDTKDLMSKKGLLITETTHIMKTGIDDAKIRLGASRIFSTMSVSNSTFSTIQLFESPSGKALIPQNTEF